MKRWIAMLIAVTLILAAVLPAAGAEEEKMSFVLSATDAKEVGDLVTISARVYHAPPCASFRVIFTYDDTILEVQDGKKGEVKGLFMLNTQAKHEGKPAVNALSADVNEVLSGDMLLFRVNFKVKKIPADGKALIPVAQTEFISSDENLSKLEPIVNGCVVKIGEPQGGEPDPIETPDPDEKTTEPDKENTDPAGTETDPVDDPGVPGDTADPIEEGEEKTDEPTGFWLIDPNAKTASYVPEGSTDATLYSIEIITEEGKIVGGELFDTEGKPAGSLELAERPNGSLEVVSQRLAEEPVKENNGKILLWILIALGAAALAAGAAVIVWAASRKKEGKE